MVEHSEDHRDIVNHKELKELLGNLAPQPDPPEPSTPEVPKDVCPPPSSLDSPTDSPKTPKKRRPFKGKKEEKPRKQSLSEAQSTETEQAKVITQFNPLAVVSKSEEFKKEFLRRIPLMLQEDEDVLVISLGYSAIECPGLQSEEKVQYLNLLNVHVLMVVLALHAEPFNLFLKKKGDSESLEIMYFVLSHLRAFMIQTYMYQTMILLICCSTVC